MFKVKKPNYSPLLERCEKIWKQNLFNKGGGIIIWRRNLGIGKEKANSLHANLMRERAMRVWDQFWAKHPNL